MITFANSPRLLKGGLVLIAAASAALQRTSSALTSRSVSAGTTCAAQYLRVRRMQGT